MTRVTAGRIRSWLVPRRPQSHRGDFGHVLVVAGSRGMTGAARLCATGALRAGAGLVTLAVPREQQGTVAQGKPWSIMTLGLTDTREGCLDFRSLAQVLDFVRRRKVTSVAVGPGLSVTSETIRFVRGLIQKIDLPMVLDADALNALSTIGWPREHAARLIITPHPGEMARVLKAESDWVNSHRIAAVKKAAVQTRAVAVLKGHRTLISDGQTIFEIGSGNPGLAKGGTGDVLCGVIAALVGQVSAISDPVRMIRAAVVGAFVHGLAADLAVRSIPRISLTAEDVLDFLPDAFRKCFGKRI